jgi:signal transduction histidine kinase
MEYSFSTILTQYRTLIIQQWVEKLHTECGEQYAARPVEELNQTITQAVDANYQILVNKNYNDVNIFIDKITDMRLKAGFLLSDVQKAFELYRIILIDLLIINAPSKKLHEFFVQLNLCLSYTMNRFSDHFQDMQQKKLLEHNKKLEQTVKKRTAALRESERMAYIGHITASLSHEIRNPLSAVKMNLQILSHNREITGNDKRRVDISVSEVIRLEKILTQLLDFAKPLELNLKPCNISHILKSYIELLEIKFREKKLDVMTYFVDELPLLMADGDKLGQAFINILINAIESSEPFGKISVTFKKSVKHDCEYAVVIIKDEGHGFKQHNITQIFKPFFTTKTKGIGLGLANVRRIVQAHNGFVEAKNSETTGAVFKIMIPAGKI